MGDEVIVDDPASPHHGKTVTIASNSPDHNGWWNTRGIPGAVHFRESQLRRA
jgi:hypothetical protein